MSENVGTPNKSRLEELRQKYAPELDPKPYTCAYWHDFHRYAVQDGYSMRRHFVPRSMYEQNEEAYNVTPR
jgi:hypothetical protein